MGYKVHTSRETKVCGCGNGEIVYEVQTKDSDYPPFDEEISRKIIEINCNTCKSK